MKEVGYQQRVVNERDSLQDKIGSLEAFINTHTYDDLPAAEQIRLAHQRNAMTMYRDILNERIAAFVAAAREC